jgi:hypothetical protein
LISNSPCFDPPIISFSARVLSKNGSSLAWFRNSSDHVQLAIRIADVGVSAFVCKGDVIITIVLYECFCANSMVSFLMAFGFTCLQNSGVATRSVIAALCGIIFILTFWCIWTSWRNQEASDVSEPKRTILTFEEDHAKRKGKGFKFTREDLDTTKSPPTKRPVTTTPSPVLDDRLKVPFTKLRRHSSKKADEESIHEMESIHENGSIDYT